MPVPPNAQLPSPSWPAPSRFVRPLAALVLLAGCSLGQLRAGEAARIVEVLELEPGMVVADVGAGDGEWAFELAEVVGALGKVYATEVESDLVEELREEAADKGFDNVIAVEGDQTTTGLPASCCQAILLRMVYHHFTDPPAMRRALLEALRPGGRIAVIDIVPQSGWGELDGVPERGGHGIERDDVVAEMLGAGFELVSSHPDWRGDEEERYCVVFRKRLS